MIQAEQIEYDDWMARLHTSAEVDLVEDALAAGRRMSMADAVALATAPPEAKTG